MSTQQISIVCKSTCCQLLFHYAFQAQQIKLCFFEVLEDWGLQRPVRNEKSLWHFQVYWTVSHLAFMKRQLRNSTISWAMRRQQYFTTPSSTFTIHPSLTITDNFAQLLLPPLLIKIFRSWAPLKNRIGFNKNGSYISRVTEFL